MDGNELPFLQPAETGPAPKEPEVELTRHTIVPDRYDDFEPAPSIPPVEEAGLRTVRIPSEAPAGSFGIPAPENGERGTAVQSPIESWDELASGLTAAPPPASPESAPPEPPFRDFVPPLVGQAAAPSPPPEEPPPAPWEKDSRGSAAASPSIPPGSSNLDPVDVERIASRLVEQISDKVIREIAWEVIPELAETLIKQRIRELEEKISREG